MAIKVLIGEKIWGTLMTKDIQIIMKIYKPCKKKHEVGKFKFALGSRLRPSSRHEPHNIQRIPEEEVAFLYRMYTAPYDVSCR